MTGSDLIIVDNFSGGDADIRGDLRDRGIDADAQGGGGVEAERGLWEHPICSRPHPSARQALLPATENHLHALFVVTRAMKFVAVTWPDDLQHLR